jgi:starch synthase
MNIVMVSSEMGPFSKTGGLGDVLGTLPYALSELGHDVSVFIPFYRSVPATSPELLFQSDVSMGQRRVVFEVFRIHRRGRVNVYAIRKDEYFDRSYLYGSPREYDDNAERFIFFSKAVVHSMQSLGMRVQIVHAHDWQAALVPVYLQRSREGVFPRVPTVFTIHNLAYQGLFDAHEFQRTNLDPSLFSTDGLEFFGRMNLMKGGILFANAVTTVSPRYAAEIQTAEYGYGLDGVLRSRKDSVHGILNGVDYSEWNPEKDQHLAQNFNVDTLATKKSCREALIQELKLTSNSRKPVFGIVTRLAHQKGIDLLLQTFSEMLSKGALLAILANGDTKYEGAFEQFARSYPKQFGLKIGFDGGLAHRIYAGSDFFLMPSLYEPCGLSQLYAMRYGSIPIVRATGGLEDTIRAWEPGQKDGTGIKFDKAEPAALLTAFQQAMDLYKKPTVLAALRKNGMSANFSWEKSAREYEKLYQSLQG